MLTYIYCESYIVNRISTCGNVELAGARAEVRGVVRTTDDEAAEGGIFSGVWPNPCFGAYEYPRLNIPS